MKVKLYNEEMQVEIDSKGAELESIFHKGCQLEYMWNADPVYWGKHSPVLFPIVGQLKDNTYLYNDKAYHLSRHGFARDRDFIVEHSAATEATFLLVSDKESLEVYPFDFEFRIHYSLDGSTLSVTYDVFNTGRGEMYFSVGGHPAFKIPLVEGTTYEDYYLEFEHNETIGRMALQNGLIGKAVPFMNYERHLHLSRQLFYSDAIVLKGLKSDSVWLKSDKTKHGFMFDMEGFPYLGIWAAKDADFVCIEPWEGIADSIGHNGELKEKEGIIRCEPAHRWQECWKLTCF